MEPFCGESTQLWRKVTAIDQITVCVDCDKQVVFYQPVACASQRWDLAAPGDFGQGDSETGHCVISPEVLLGPKSLREGGSSEEDRNGEKTLDWRHYYIVACSP